MKKGKYLLVVLLVALLVACLQVSAAGQTANQLTDAKAVSIRPEGMGVRFEPAIQYTSAVLTVSGPDGTVLRQEFTGGSALLFSLLDKTGAALGNGVYTYEIRLSNSRMRDTKERAAATADDGREDDQGRISRRRIPVQSTVQSGSFSVVEGVVYAGNEIEPTDRRRLSANGMGRENPKLQTTISSANTLNRLRNHRMFIGAMPDIVQADDVIVQGSECVGLDCVNNENFGFDTIRLKENNDRIQFDDTSTAAGFPTNNWQIRANSSSSGGESFLGFVDQGATGNSETGTIVFQVNAGAPANSLKVDSTGRLGLRTATPVLDVHVNTSNTPALRYEQNNSGGFTAQTWDVAGNEANFFVRDVTGGSRLPFRIRPGAPTSSIDISASGNVGIGTASPTTGFGSFGPLVDIKGGSTTFPEISLDATSATGGHNFVLVSDATPAFYVRDLTTSTTPFFINGTGRVGIGTSSPDQVLSVNGDASKAGGGSWQVFSDERLKSIKGNFNSGLRALMQLQPLRYHYKRDNALGLKSEGEHVGFGAQAVQKIIPEAVTRSDSGYLTINNDPIIWTMLNAIKEQQKEIAELKGKVRRLQAASRKHAK